MFRSGIWHWQQEFDIDILLGRYDLSPQIAHPLILILFQILSISIVLDSRKSLPENLSKAKLSIIPFLMHESNRK